MCADYISLIRIFYSGEKISNIKLYNTVDIFLSRLLCSYSLIVDIIYISLFIVSVKSQVKHHVDLKSDLSQINVDLNLI